MIIIKFGNMMEGINKKVIFQKPVLKLSRKNIDSSVISQTLTTPPTAILKHQATTD
ncbi:hypothetical protein QQ020_14770 [Fulvivirgaceae bacterium BMA12]|uniref:Uncharacterized protein n=1 Tax=Agaribacillus aureus TaxID=3051825 RepID=A0ABT8L6F3_9BACT|nr:hypothetical protein [Fulvivirgaceae bacterium BMA12]